LSEINKDEEAQLQWEKEAKRLQEAKNPQPTPEPVVEPSCRTNS